MSESDGAIRPLVAGNWKMNGLKSAFPEAVAVAEALSKPQAAPVDVMICPPASMIMVMREVTRDHPLRIGAQDCHTAESGAHTGDLSAEILNDAGADAIIIGHSERRSDHGELSRDVRAKSEAAHRAGVTAIICIGETLGERRAEITLDVVKRQLLHSVPDGATDENTVIAYEPVWAIGTGVTPTPDDVREVHGAIRAALTDRFGTAGSKMRILYGGSVKPDNAAELMAIPHVNGALVGGASLKASDFLAIVGSYQPSAPERS